MLANFGVVYYICPSILQDHIDVIVRQETLPMVAGHPVMLQLCVVPVAA